MTLDREDYFFTPRYTRGQVCKVLGITRDTIRHYEDCGLIKPQENEQNKYKYYSMTDLEILNVILFLRSIDVPIQEIPKFIECKDIDLYGNFLDEQINKAISKIDYWNHVKTILTYLKNTLENYQNIPHKVSILENTVFKFRVVKFDYENNDIEKMLPSRLSSQSYSHIIKLKIVDQNWLLTNREDVSNLIVGHLDEEGSEPDEDIFVHTLPLSVMITTLEPINKLTDIIIGYRKKYGKKYELDEKVYIIEHTFFNVFSQSALIRNIYLPILKVK